MLHANDQQPTPSIAGRLPLPAKASQKPRAEALVLLALLVSQLPGVCPFRLSPPEGQSALVNQ
eukprot:scaffold46243_cov67-Phaeocystis_antarctica.AAC.1